MAKGKKTVKSIAMTIGFLVALIGLCICACETTMDKQMVNFAIGIPVMLVGAAGIWFGVEGNEFDANNTEE